MKSIFSMVKEALPAIVFCVIALTAVVWVRGAMLIPYLIK